MGVDFDNKLVVGWELDPSNGFIQYLLKHGGKDDGKYDPEVDDEEDAEDVYDVQFDDYKIEPPAGLHIFHTYPRHDEPPNYYISLFSYYKTEVSLAACNKPLSEECIRWLTLAGCDPDDRTVMSVLHVH